MFIKRAILIVVAATVITAPAVAQVTVTIDPDGLGTGYYFVSSSNGGNIFTHADGSQSVFHQVSGAKPLTLQEADLGRPVYVSMLRLQQTGEYFWVEELDNGNYTVHSNSPNLIGSVNTPNPAVSFATAPVNFVTSGSENGWLITGHNITGSQAGDGSMNFPLVFSNMQLQTPGGNTFFARAANGMVTVNTASSTANMTFVESQNTLTVSPESVITIGFKVDEEFPATGWYLGLGSNGSGYGTLVVPHGFGGGYTGEIRFVPGTYDIVTSNVTSNIDAYDWKGGAWANGISGFVLPANAVDIEWSDVLVFHGKDGDGNDKDYYIHFWAVQPIPEPATMSLLALGGFALLRRRHR